MGLVAGAVDVGSAVGTAALAAMGSAVSGPALLAAAVTLAGAGTVVAGAGAGGGPVQCPNVPDGGLRHWKMVGSP